VGRRAALLVEMARLRLEVSASRARLQLAGYEERKRVERDLHDGAQQRLVALGMRLRHAQRDSGTDVNKLIDGAVNELGHAVEDLRAIAQGLRPSGLDDGLAAALAGLSEGYPIPLTIDVADLDDTPEDVALTAYFVACEALTNSAKHSRAREVCVQVRRTGKDLWMCVRDDGRGGASTSGSGLSGLRDRVAASGGELRLISTEAGTTVEAVLPCG
jgi:signal transduction histidine kinase